MNNMRAFSKRVMCGVAVFLLAACTRQTEPPTPIVITVVTLVTAVPPTITPQSTETTAPTAVPSSTPLPTITPQPQRPTRTPIILPIYSPTPVPPTAIPVATAVPPPPITEWRGEYFNNLSLIGQPNVIRNDRSVDFDWVTGSPDPCCSS